MFVCIHICLCKSARSLCVFSVWCLTISTCKPSNLASFQLLRHAYTDSFFFFCMSICITPIHCLCMPLFLPMYRKVGVPLFCLRCWPKSQVCCNPNSIFPERCFYSASWAITVIAVIIGIILTLVPLCSRKGLTLGAIYADWLDQPGIPKVRDVLQYFFFWLSLK